MDFSTVGSYTLESAATLLIVVMAYKLYKLRAATESDCCQHAFRLKTVSRGDSDSDLQLKSIRSIPEPDNSVV